MTLTDVELPLLRDQLKCNFEQIDDVFDDCVKDAITHLSEF